VFGGALSSGAFLDFFTNRHSALYLCTCFFRSKLSITPSPLICCFLVLQVYSIYVNKGYQRFDVPTGSINFKVRPPAQHNRVLWLFSPDMIVCFTARAVGQGIVIHSEAAHYAI
jgi:hypothetical protein